MMAGQKGVKMEKLTYKDYTKARQEEWNALPIFYAYGQDQFEKALREHGYNAKDLVRIGLGGFCHKNDVPAINAFIEADRLGELMKDYDFAYEAIYYEMANHEYHINWEGDYDVCACFGSIEYHGEDVAAYFKELGWGADTIRAYVNARRAFLDNAKY